MVDHARLSVVLGTFARNLVTGYDVAKVLEMLTQHVTEILPVAGCGVMLYDEQSVLRFVTASDEVIRHIEALQVEFGEGPCLHAATTGEPVVIQDLAASERFPLFSAKALEHGVRAVYSFPMAVEDARVGALNLYRDEPDGWGMEDAEAGQLLADVAMGYIVNAQTLADSSALTHQLQHALDSRIVVEQAKGKLSALLDVDVVRAFEVMRRYARNHGERLRDVAQRVMDGTLSLSVEE